MMNARATNKRRHGFTLIELLVVMAIIALLITLLIPAFSGIGKKAKGAKTQSQFNALSLGLDQYRSEQALGGEYPPSRSDYTADQRKVSDPKSLSAVPQPDTKTAGANLLVYAMLGADLQGTPGFKDINRDGIWSNDTHAGPNGAYEITQSGDKAGQPVRPRYGSYVSDDMRASVASLEKLDEEGKLFSDGGLPDASKEQPFFTDAWDHPILYFRSSKAAKNMVVPVSGGEPGIYRQADNAIFTGSNMANMNEPGVDFGYGKVDTQYFHRIAKAVDAPVIPVVQNGENAILTDAQFDDSFTRFVLDDSIKTRNTPVRKDAYLLISAGDDGIYGTDDDVINWQREGK